MDLELAGAVALPRVALLIKAFSKLDDSREPWRVAFPLAEVLLLLTCATICGCDDFEDIVAWGHNHLDFLRRLEVAGREVHGTADLAGQRVGVQFNSGPQNLLATRAEITSVTFLEPQDAMAALAVGTIDGAFIWGPVVGYLDKTVYADRFRVVPVAGEGPQWPASVGFANCHGPDAIQSARRINLRLLQHRYGERMGEVFLTTVTHGRPEKGMPNWSDVFTMDHFGDILAYLHGVQSQ